MDSQSGPPPEGQGLVSAGGWLGFLLCAQGTAFRVLPRPFLFLGGEVYLRIGWDVHPRGIPIRMASALPLSPSLVPPGPAGSLGLCSGD